MPEGRLLRFSRHCQAVFLNLSTCRMLQSAAECSMTSTPSKTIRLSVPVTPEVQATFQRLAQASGRSMAASMSQWLLDTQQAAELMADNIERLRSSPGDVVARVKLHTASLEDFAEQAIEDAMARADDWDVEERLRRGGAPRSRGSAAAQKLPSPPSSNTGGKGTKREGPGASAK